MGGALVFLFSLQLAAFILALIRMMGGKDCAPLFGLAAILGVIIQFL